MPTPPLRVAVQLIAVAPERPDVAFELAAQFTEVVALKPWLFPSAMHPVARVATMPVPVFEVAVESVTLVAMIPARPRFNLAEQLETLSALVMPVPPLASAVHPVSVAADNPVPSLSISLQLVKVPLRATI